MKQGRVGLARKVVAREIKSKTMEAERRDASLHKSRESGGSSFGKFSTLVRGRDGDVRLHGNQRRITSAGGATATVCQSRFCTPVGKVVEVVVRPKWRRECNLGSARQSFRIFVSKAALASFGWDLVSRALFSKCSLELAAWTKANF